LPAAKLGLIIFLAIILGVISGFFLYTGKRLLSGQGKQIFFSSKKPEEQAKSAAGIVDKKTFKDKAEGILREGGIDGEGQFHLERPGGESQNVYLTSTTVDLSQYLGKKVRVWGETFKAEKAGWLMDVGLVEVL